LSDTGRFWHHLFLVGLIEELVGDLVVLMSLCPLEATVVLVAAGVMPKLCLRPAANKINPNCVM